MNLANHIIPTGLDVNGGGIASLEEGRQPCGQGCRLAIVRLPVQTLPPRVYCGNLVVWPGMPFLNLDGRIHQSPLDGGEIN